MLESTTVNSAGKRMVQIRTMEAEKQRCIVMIAITANGQKLPPYVVFKHKTTAKEKFPQVIIVRVQESGWMTEDLVDDWIKSVWFQRPGCTVMPAIHAGFGQLPEPDHRKCQGPIAT
jgi:hypothetical protein